MCIRDRDTAQTLEKICSRPTWGLTSKTKSYQRVKIRKWAKMAELSVVCSFSDFYALINFLFFNFRPYVGREQMFLEVWTASPPNLKTIRGLGQILEQKIEKKQQFSIGITPKFSPKQQLLGKTRESIMPSIFQLSMINIIHYTVSVTRHVIMGIESYYGIIFQCTYILIDTTEL